MTFHIIYEKVRIFGENNLFPQSDICHEYENVKNKIRKQ